MNKPQTVMYINIFKWTAQSAKGVQLEDTMNEFMRSLCAPLNRLVIWFVTLQVIYTFYSYLIRIRFDGMCNVWFILRSSLCANRRFFWDEFRVYANEKRQEWHNCSRIHGLHCTMLDLVICILICGRINFDLWFEISRTCGRWNSI